MDNKYQSGGFKINQNYGFGRPYVNGFGESTKGWNLINADELFKFSPSFLVDPSKMFIYKGIDFGSGTEQQQYGSENYDTGYLDALKCGLDILNISSDLARKPDTTSLENQIGDISDYRSSALTSRSLQNEVSQGFQDPTVSYDSIGGISGWDAAKGMLSGTATGAMYGAKIGGIPGAIAGGAVGLFSTGIGSIIGSTRAANEADRLRSELVSARTARANSISNNANNINSMNNSNWIKNKRSFQAGGELDSPVSGFTTFNSGGTHQQNPMGGIQQGIGNNGQPNLVEEGETKYNDYIFSNRIKANEKILRDMKVFKNGKELDNAKGKTYAELSKEIAMSTGYEASPTDPVSIETFNNMIARLRDAEEYQKQIEAQRKMARELSKLPPEQLQQMAQQSGIVGTEGGVGFSKGGNLFQNAGRLTFTMPVARPMYMEPDATRIQNPETAIAANESGANIAYARRLGEINPTTQEHSEVERRIAEAVLNPRVDFRTPLNALSITGIPVVSDLSDFSLAANDFVDALALRFSGYKDLSKESFKDAGINAMFAMTPFLGSGTRNIGNRLFGNGNKLSNSERKYYTERRNALDAQLGRVERGEDYFGYGSYSEAKRAITEQMDEIDNILQSNPKNIDGVDGIKKIEPDEPVREFEKPNDIDEYYEPSSLNNYPLDDIEIESGITTRLSSEELDEFKKKLHEKANAVRFNDAVNRAKSTGRNQIIEINGVKYSVDGGRNAVKVNDDIHSGLKDAMDEEYKLQQDNIANLERKNKIKSELKDALDEKSFKSIMHDSSKMKELDDLIINGVDPVDAAVALGAKRKTNFNGNPIYTVGEDVPYSHIYSLPDDATDEDIIKAISGSENFEGIIKDSSRDRISVSNGGDVNKTLYIDNEGNLTFDKSKKRDRKYSFSGKDKDDFSLDDFKEYDQNEYINAIDENRSHYVNYDDNIVVIDRDGNKVYSGITHKDEKDVLEELKKGRSDLYDEIMAKEAEKNGKKTFVGADGRVFEYYEPMGNFPGQWVSTNLSSNVYKNLKRDVDVKRDFFGLGKLSTKAFLGSRAGIARGIASRSEKEAIKSVSIGNISRAARKDAKSHKYNDIAEELSARKGVVDSRQTGSFVCPKYMSVHPGMRAVMNALGIGTTAGIVGAINAGIKSSRDNNSFDSYEDDNVGIAEPVQSPVQSAEPQSIDIDRTFDSIYDAINNTYQEGGRLGLRYTPVVNNAVNVLTDAVGLTNKPDYSNAKSIENSVRRPMRIGYTPVGMYQQYRPIDSQYLGAMLSREAAANRRSAMNSANGNMAVALANLAAQSRASQEALGNLGISTSSNNNTQRNAVISANNAIDAANAERAMKIEAQNQSADEAYMRTLAESRIRGAMLRESIANASETAKAKNIEELTKSLGKIGNEDWMIRQIKENPYFLYYITQNGGLGYKGNTGAYGGMLGVKKKVGLK